ncbi:MAG: alpha/beta hydrolase family protein [Fimbriimonas sp.]
MDAQVINRMLEQRVKDLAARPPEMTREERLVGLRKALGLEPMPPRTALNASVTGTVEREGYRIDKVRYESRPGVLVTAHLYLPNDDGRHPVILRPHGHWSGKKSEPLVQASAIGLALSGFAVFVVDSPGRSWDDNPQNERAGMGPHEDPFLTMGAPIQGVYAWDLIRGLDYLETRPEVDAQRVGITGASGGGAATMYAFAIEPRIRAAVPVCGISSQEINPHQGCLCNHVPGIALLGDRSDILALRADDGALFVIAAEDDPEFPLEGHRKMDEKLKRAFRAARGEHRYRHEVFPFGHDYNRRMREAAHAFFREHLLGEPARVYAAEPLPLTDGNANPAPANTVPFDDPSLTVVPPEERFTLSFRELLDRALAEPYPQPFEADRRLVPWVRYAKMPEVKAGPFVAIHDAGLTPKEDDSLVLPFDEIDFRLCAYLGISIGELFGQILHLAMPGGPSTWEEKGMSGDALTSLVASMRTLVGGAPSGPPPGLLIAEGPVSSFAATFVKRLRPDLVLQVTHPITGWNDAFQIHLTALIQPQARYLAFS